MLHQELGSFFTSAFVGFEIDIDLHVGDDIEAVDVTALIKHSGIIRFEEDDVRAGRHRYPDRSCHRRDISRAERL